MQFAPLVPVNNVCVQMEEAILGGILLDPDVLPAVGDLPVAAFSISSHRLIYNAILDVKKEGYIPEMNTVTLKMLVTGTLQEAGGQAKLAQLLDRTVHSGYVKQYADILMSQYQRYYRIMQLTKAAEILESEPDHETAYQKAQKHIELFSKPSKYEERLEADIRELLLEENIFRKAVLRATIYSRHKLGNAAIDELLRGMKVDTLQEQVEALGIKDLFDSTEPALEYVIPGMLPVGDSIILTGDPKCGKTLLAYDAAFAIATGESDFLGERCKQGRVLIIQTDESKATMRSRLFTCGFRPEDGDNVRFMNNFNIIQLPQLDKTLEEFKPSLVIVDNLRNINAGSAISENSAEFADQIMYMRKLLSKHGASGIFIHHSNKNPDAIGVQRSRGSSAIPGAVWGMWQLDHIPKPDPNNKKKKIIDPDDPNRILSIQVRDAEGQRLKIELEPGNNHYLNHGREGVSEEQQRENKSREDRIVEILKPIAPRGMEPEELNEKLGLGRGIYSALHRLVGKRIIGTRASTVDKRKTVYYYPTDSSGDTDGTPTPTPGNEIEIEMPESSTVVDVEALISNGSQDDLIRSQEFDPSTGENAPTVDTAGTPEVDLNIDPPYEVSPEINEEVEIPTEKGENNLTEIIETTDTEIQIVPTEVSVQFQVGDVVRTSDNQEGIVDLVNVDGGVVLQIGNKFVLFGADELTAVEPAAANPQPQQPKFEVCQVVTSKKGFKTGKVQGFAKDGRLIVEWRVNKKQTQVEYVNPADVN